MNRLVENLVAEATPAEDGDSHFPAQPLGFGELDLLHPAKNAGEDVVEEAGQHPSRTFRR